MAKVTMEYLAAAILEADKMDMKQKETVFDEIYIEQPNIIGSVLVLQQMGNTLEQMDVLINVLLVSYLALKEAGLKLKTVTEHEQERELSRFVGHAHFIEGLSSASEAEVMQQYFDSHEEKALLAFVYGEMKNAGFIGLKYENSKYLIIAGINIVNCISVARLA